MLTSAFTCTGPYAVLIMLGIKRVENRSAMPVPAKVFGEALKAGARSIVVAHNHPSGDLTPSVADIATTKKLRETGNMLGVSLLDHLILGSDSRFTIVNARKG